MTPCGEYPSHCDSRVPYLRPGPGIRGAADHRHGPQARTPAYAVGVRDAGDWEAAMGSTDRHGIRRSTGVVVAFAAMAASIVVACGPEPFVDDSAKPGPRNGRLASCTFHEAGQDEGGTFEFDGTVWISYTKAH